MSINISANKQRFISLLREYVAVDGVEKLIEYLEVADILSAVTLPMSTNRTKRLRG